jgi:hypothetical protein
MLKYKPKKIFEYNPFFDDLMKFCIKKKICIENLGYIHCDDPSYYDNKKYEVEQYGSIRLVEK